MGCTDNFSSHPRDVHIYDARCLKPRRSQPLLSLAEHTKSIASAYFSPVTGNRVVTTCADCKLRYSKKTEPCFLGNLETAAMVFVTRSCVYCCCYGITSITVIIVPLFPSFHFYSLSPTPSFFVPLPGLPVFQADLELALFLLWPLEYWDYRCVSPCQLGEALLLGKAGSTLKVC